MFITNTMVQINESKISFVILIKTLIKRLYYEIEIHTALEGREDSL